MGNFARIVAGAGALAGGYLQGQKMIQDQQWEEEKRQREREESAREKAAREAAADTLAKVGTQMVNPSDTGAILSSEQQAMMARDIADFGPEAGKSIVDSVARDAATPEARAAAAGIKATPYTQEQAQGDYVRKLYAIDPLKAQQAEAAQLTLDEKRDSTETRKKLKGVDAALRTWGEKALPRDANGEPMVNDDAMVKMTKMRTLLLSQQGLYDQARQTALDGMSYAKAKIETETAERQAAVRDAVAAAGMGDFTKAAEVYRRFVPDGADPGEIKVNKDGTLTLTRKSALDDANLPAITFKNMDHFLSTLNSLADGKALGAYVERTFQHDIESRKVKADETKAAAAVTSAGASVKNAETAANKEQRANDKDDKLTAASAAYQSAIDSGDEKAIKKARVAFIAAGGKPEKIEAVKGEFKPNPMGMGGTVVQSGPDGSVVVTPMPMDAKGPMRIGAPGSATAAPRLGEERTIQAGPDKGKTAVFDGKGWAVKG